MLGCVIPVIQLKGLWKREKLLEQQLYAGPQRCLKLPQNPNLVSYYHRIIEQDPSFKVQLVPWKQPLRVLHHHQVTRTPPHLDGAVQRRLVLLLELRPDVLQVQLRPGHHDSGQSRLVGSAALTTTRAHLYFYKMATIALEGPGELLAAYSPSCFYAGVLQSRQEHCSHTWLETGSRGGIKLQIFPFCLCPSDISRILGLTDGEQQRLQLPRHLTLDALLQGFPTNAGVFHKRCPCRENVGQSRSTRATVCSGWPTLFELWDAPFAEDVDEFHFIGAPFLLPGIIKGLPGKKNF